MPVNVGTAVPSRGGGVWNEPLQAQAPPAPSFQTLAPETGRRHIPLVQPLGVGPLPRVIQQVTLLWGHNGHPVGFDSQGSVSVRSAASFG